MLADQRQLAAAVEQSPDAIVITDLQGVITYVNQAFTKVSGYTAAEAIGDRPSLLKSGRQSAELYTELWRTVSNGGVWSGRLVNRAKDGRLFIEDAKVLPAFDSSGVPTHYIAVKRDVTAVVELERQILSAQKLEAVGRLAAGIAHEINTPTQYVGDNTRFFENSFLQILIVVQWYDRLERAVRQGEPTGDVLRGLGEAKANSDLEFALDEIPKALEQSLEGIARITEIVAAMKEFSHPGSEEKTPFDLNAGIRSTTTVARNEWKYVATLELELALALPPVPCHPGDINQVVLNLVVNAAHAIADRRAAEGTQALGVIRVATAVEGSSAEIRISDSGTGIPESIREKIFEPFFTTKAVGKGTGQGLALAHNVVVDKHGGSIACESEVGVGTTFIIRLPLRDSKLAELELEGEPTHA
ncbi:MAG: PAS domain S-box protein [Myxococcota bacterium]|nr:PAS domain S-box protein [Myxococcota bacterium]